MYRRARTDTTERQKHRHNHVRPLLLLLCFRLPIAYISTDGRDSLVLLRHFPCSLPYLIFGIYLFLPSRPRGSRKGSSCPTRRCPEWYRNRRLRTWQGKFTHETKKNRLARSSHRTVKSLSYQRVSTRQWLACESAIANYIKHHASSLSQRTYDTECRKGRG